MRSENLYIESTNEKGRGVFTSRDIPAETVVEIAPVIVMSLTDREHLDQTLLHDYIFEWGHEKQQCAMALGFVPVYNHACPSNCEYFMDFEESTIFIKTNRAISAGEELCVNYNGDSGDENPVWFQA